jgi:hypothetical protein
MTQDEAPMPEQNAFPELTLCGPRVKGKVRVGQTAA